MNKKMIGTGASLVACAALAVFLMTDHEATSEAQTEQALTGLQNSSKEQHELSQKQANQHGEARESLLSQMSGGQDLLSALSDSEFINTLEIDDRALSWAKVDLQAIREEIPDNLYWELAAPTQDETLIQHRKEVKELWRARENKISANLATEAEIREYFERQNRISEDYVEFSTLLLNRHGSDLPEQDYGMQNLARKLHLARLQDIPGQLARALENRENFLARKNEWLADKASYEAKLRQEREAALKELGKI